MEDGKDMDFFDDSEVMMDSGVTIESKPSSVDNVADEKAVTVKDNVGAMSSTSLDDGIDFSSIQSIPGLS